MLHLNVILTLDSDRTYSYRCLPLQSELESWLFCYCYSLLDDSFSTFLICCHDCHWFRGLLEDSYLDCGSDNQLQKPLYYDCSHQDNDGQCYLEKVSLFWRAIKIVSYWFQGLQTPMPSMAITFIDFLAFIYFIWHFYYKDYHFINKKMLLQSFRFVCIFLSGSVFILIHSFQ